MPSISRWMVIASFLLLNGSLSAAEHPTFDTAMSWRSRLKQAAVEARSTDKLLFVMHLSGNLAKTAFT